MNIFPHEFRVNSSDRSKFLNQNPKLIWFTGLSGSGKSTLCNSLESKLFESGYLTYSLDGDNIRNGINSNLSFGVDDRIENIRRIAELSKLFLDSGLIVLASFISPLEAMRDLVKNVVGSSNVIEIYVSTSYEDCEIRDTKGLYKKAREGKIKNFTGLDSPYEKPLNPDITIDTSNISLEDSTKILLNMIKPKLFYEKL